ncbi:hypothetical protein [Streptomyces sp. BH104]|uniref:hypothetical protein n=1 Tax=Streptomyces sp. BH104 TaxID=3410407 RepID=UPI003BB53DB7
MSAQPTPSGESAADLIAQAGRDYVPPAQREAAAASGHAYATTDAIESAEAEGSQHP